VTDDQDVWGGTVCIAWLPRHPGLMLAAMNNDTLAAGAWCWHNDYYAGR
jgi:hypothetical protein